MSQPAQTPFSNWHYYQATLLCTTRAKAVAAQKRSEEIEKRMAIERL
jgi:hypothetical protein